MTQLVKFDKQQTTLINADNGLVKRDIVTTLTLGLRQSVKCKGP
jgi:hypothetical protein